METWLQALFASDYSEIDSQNRQKAGILDADTESESEMEHATVLRLQAARCSTTVSVVCKGHETRQYQIRLPASHLSCLSAAYRLARGSRYPKSHSPIAPRPAENVLRQASDALPEGL